ncbi:FadR/GntR family transcriptional regulator [Leifsonia naganoensis]|uniref:DNA-binding FadR family transcriptional regulator n=1 Tax=Leifsonia naganoensis TaxID=150025 RepID=A0A853DK06_9MICO|nr:FadR/GntR family transcriptional regulator [Leifsonia naganoensis]NYK08597.1 DNA-binding FadR family transcriptional regulator [Leifsonia naganoensis]
MVTDQPEQPARTTGGAQRRVVETLGRAIVSGEYPPGTLLPKEEHFMAEYGVSRTPFREAAKVLAAKGLIETRQRVGTRVRAETLWSAFDSDILRWYAEVGRSEEIIRDLLELREIIEPSAARLAALRGTPADIRSIAEAQRRMDETVDDPKAYAANDVAFHLAVFAGTHNVLMQRFGNFVADFLRLSFDLQQAALLEREHVRDLTGDLAAHRFVLESLERSAPDAAAEAMLGAISSGNRELLRSAEHAVLPAEA